MCGERPLPADGRPREAEPPTTRDQQLTVSWNGRSVGAGTAAVLNVLTDTVVAVASVVVTRPGVPLLIVA